MHGQPHNRSRVMYIKLFWTKWLWTRFFFPVSSLPLSTIPSLLHNHLHLSSTFIIRTSGRSLRIFEQSKLFPEIGGRGGALHRKVPFQCWLTLNCLNTSPVAWRERNQQDATIRRLLLTSISTCFGYHYPHLQENKEPVTAFGVLFWFCWMWLVAVVGRCVVGCEHYEGFCSTSVEQKPSCDRASWAKC